MYDPTYPANNSPATAVGMRLQLNALNDKIEAQNAQIAILITQLAALTTTVTTLQAALTAIQAQLASLATIVPVGTVLPWFKDLPGAPAIPANYVECNGQFLSDPESPLDGQLMPDINNGAQRFMRGGLTSGVTGGSDTFATAPADFSGGGGGNNFVTTDFSPGATPIPPYVTAVHIMRVK